MPRSDGTRARVTQNQSERWSIRSTATIETTAGTMATRMMRLGGPDRLRLLDGGLVLRAVARPNAWPSTDTAARAVTVSSCAAVRCVSAGYWGWRTENTT